MGEAAVEPTGRVWADTADLLTPSLLAGRGLAVQPKFLVWRKVRDRRLEVIMPDHSPPTLNPHLITPSSPLRPRRAQVRLEPLAASLARPQCGVRAAPPPG